MPPTILVENTSTAEFFMPIDGKVCANPYTCGQYNLKTREPGLGAIQATIATPELGLGIDQLCDVSESLGHTVYLLPEGCSIVFDEEGYLVKVSGENANGLWQFINGWPMPYQCFANGFPFAFDMQAMWEADVPVESVSVDELRWNLDYPWWLSNDDQPYALKPRDVMENLGVYPVHQERVANADMTFPLTLGKTLQGRWLILDGVHRYIKALMDGEVSVRAKRFELSSLRGYVNPRDYVRFDRWVRSKPL